MIGRHCSGVVIAGGASRRFGGRPKGLSEVGGRPIVDRVLEAVRAATDECYLITNDSRVRDVMHDVPVFADTRRERAGLVGLHSALTHCRDAALVVAWDMPFVSAALLRELRQRGEALNLVAIPTGPRGPEPFCAYYPRNVLDIVTAQLEQGELRLSAFVEALPSSAILSPNEVAAFGPAARTFANVNSEADLAAARSMVDERGAEFALASNTERR